MATQTLNPPQARKWTREEFYRLDDLGVFNDERVELIEGEIIDMGVQGAPHFFVTDQTASVLRKVFGEGYWVRTQGPLTLGINSDPVPDISVVSESLRDPKKHPTTALLVVEVSETSLAYDRERKASLYARAGIEDYWIVNLISRQLEIYRGAVPNSSMPYRFGYSDIKFFSAQETVTPLAAPETSIFVADLLP